MKHTLLILLTLATGSIQLFSQNNAPIIQQLLILEDEQGAQGVVQKILKGVVKNDQENSIYTYRILSGNATLEQINKRAILHPQDENEIVIELKVTNKKGLSSVKKTTYFDLDVIPEKLYLDKNTWMKAIGTKLQNNLSYQFQERNEDLPNVLIIGNSISIGYTPYVQEALKGKCNVYRIPENGGDTKRCLKKLNFWLGDNNWDVIHFNFGLHDLKKVKNNKLNDNGEVVNTTEVYANNLKKIIAQLQTQTDAKLIWASTSVIPEGSSGRIKGDEVAYNNVAKRIMIDNNIIIDAQYTLTLNHPKEQRAANVHFLPKGMKRQGNQAAQYILKYIDSF